MTAGELRGLTGGAVLACSPVVFELADGRRLHFLGHQLKGEAVTDPETGQRKPGSVPVLTLVLDDTQRRA